MASHDAFTDRLSDYLDDEDLGERERLEIAAHVEGCAECRATLRELRAVTARAAGLVDTPPDTDSVAGSAPANRRLTRAGGVSVSARDPATAFLVHASRNSWPPVWRSWFFPVARSGSCVTVDRRPSFTRWPPHRWRVRSRPANFCGSALRRSNRGSREGARVRPRQARIRRPSACWRTTSTRSIGPSISAAARLPRIRRTCTSTATWRKRGIASSRSSAVSARSSTRRVDRTDASADRTRSRFGTRRRHALGARPPGLGACGRAGGVHSSLRRPRSARSDRPRHARDAR